MEKIYGSFDLETIGSLADIVSSRELSELTITDGDKTITIKGKKCPPPPPATIMQAPAAVSAPQPAAAAPSSAGKVDTVIDGNIVKSPIIGTFYAAPAPDKPPFVKVGDTVKKGDVIMIIESMKLMNEIQSDFNGTVDKILVSDGQAVEFDQPIMVIK